jgi:endonuclease/exonuclease/phosphatase (EEP) superfamily protein YafD
MRRISGDDSTSNAVLRDTEQKMKSSILRRPRQVEAVLSDIENSPYEAIVAGDFNDTPMSYTYYRLKRGRKDSFVEAGKGFGATYALLRPFVRIDYVLVPESISVTSHDVGKVYFSDHFPVITTVSLENNPEQ